MAVLTMAPFTMAVLTMALLTMALLTMALFTMALLAMARSYGVLPFSDEQCRLGERGSDHSLGSRLNDLNPSCKQACNPQP